MDCNACAVVKMAVVPIWAPRVARCESTVLAPVVPSIADSIRWPGSPVTDPVTVAAADRADAVDRGNPQAEQGDATVDNAGRRYQSTRRPIREATPIPGRLPSDVDRDELVDVPQPDGSVIAKRRGDLNFDDLTARARASADTAKSDRASIKDLRGKRELDWHRAELLRLRKWARAAKLKYKPS